MAAKPGCGQLGYLLQGAGLLEEVARARDHGEVVGTPESG